MAAKMCIQSMHTVAYNELHTIHNWSNGYTKILTFVIRPEFLSKKYLKEFSKVLQII